MKKVLSFVLVLALVLGSFSMVFAAPADVAGADCEKAVAALTELGVVTGYPDGTYKPENAVNRAEAAKLVITALGLAEYAEGNTASFTDLAGYGWAEGYIGYAEALGILKGDGNGLYRPADTVSYQEMATMLVRACGYTDASLPGTWPANYVVKAKALGIMDGIANAGSAAANRGDVAIMLYNNLDNEIGTINLDNQWIANTPADSMMIRLDQRLYNLDADTNANATYISSTTGAGAAFVYDGTQAVADGVNLKAYLGAAVVAYANSDNEITGLKEVKSKFVSGEFSVDNGKVILTLADDTEYRLDGSKGMNVTAATTVGAIADNFIENGADVTNITGVTNATSTISALDNMTFAVKISGNYIKAIYSVSNWEAAGVVQWDEDLAEELAEENTLNTATFVMTQKDEIDTESFALLGVDSLDEIAEDNVVTYYTNADGIARVEVGTTVAEGTVDMVNNESYDSTTKLTINEKTYKLTQTSGADNSEAVLGAEGEFFLDYAGKIAFTDVVVDSADSYAIVTLAADQESGYDNTAYKVKMLTTAGENIYKIKKSDNVTIAGILSPAGVLAAYDLNSDGEVTTAVAITTASATKYTAKGLMDGYRLADDVVVFMYDADGDWSLGTVKDIPVDSSLSDVDYYYNATSKKIEVVILGPSAVASDDAYGVIVTYNTVKVGDDKVYKVNILVDGVADTVYTDDNSVANITSTELVKFDFSGDKLTTVTPVISTVAAVKAIVAEGVQVSGSAVYYDYTTGSAGEATAADGKIVDVADDVVVYYLDSEDGFSAAKLSDIKKGYTVKMYQMDKDDVEVDIIIFTK